RANFEPVRLTVGQLQHVIEKSVLFIPHARISAGVNRGGSDRDKVLEESERHVGVSRILRCQFDGDFQHVKAAKCHPCRAICLLEITAGWQWSAAVEYTDIIQAEESPFEGVFAGPVLSIQPPREVQQQLLK